MSADEKKKQSWSKLHLNHTQYTHQLPHCDQKDNNNKIFSIKFIYSVSFSQKFDEILNEFKYK